MENKTLEINLAPGEKTRVIGDIHHAESYRIYALYEAIKAGIFGKISRVISLGDIDGAKTYNTIMGVDELLGNIGIKVHHIIGNHDEAWLEYTKTSKKSTRRKINQSEDPKMIGNKRIQEFIESMWDQILLGNHITMQHALVSPDSTIQWPIKTRETLSATHEYMRDIKRRIFIVGHDHRNYISSDTGEVTRYPLLKYGTQTQAINLEGHPSIIGVGRFDEEGNVAVLTAEEDETHSITFHKPWNDPSVYYQ